MAPVPRKEGSRTYEQQHISLNKPKPTSRRHENLRQAAVLAGLLACAMPLEAASTVQFASTGYNVAENAGSVALSVRRTDDVDTVVQVDYASSDGTAIAGKKYVAVAETLDFEAGETNKLIVVSILNESFVEGTVMASRPTAPL